MLRIDPEGDAEEIPSALGSATPRVDVPGDVHVGQPDDAPRRRAPRGPLHSGIRNLVGNIVDARADVERDLLAQDAGGVRCDALTPVRRGVQPQRVEIRVHDVRRHVAGHLVEEGERRRVRPQCVAHPHEDPAAIAAHGGRRHDSSCFDGAGRFRDRAALGGEGPRHEVNVVIPQTRHDPGALDIEHGASTTQIPRRCDVADAPVCEPEIEEAVSLDVGVGDQVASLPRDADVRDDIDDGAEVHTPHF